MAELGGAIRTIAPPRGFLSNFYKAILADLTGLFHGFFLHILAQRTKQKILGSHYTKKSLTTQKIENSL